MPLLASIPVPGAGPLGGPSSAGGEQAAEAREHARAGESAVVGPVVVRGELGRRADRFLERAAREHGFAGVLLLAMDGEVVLRKGYGLADRRRGLPYTPGTFLDIGSLTKQFTAAAILALEAEGKLSVGDTLAEHFPDAPADKAGITLHQLLTHSAGFESGFGGDYEVMPRDSLVRLALESTLRFLPGSDWGYSNVGYSLLGTIIEKVTGFPYERYLYERLLAPAGLHETGYVIPDFDLRRVPGGITEEGEYWGTPLDSLWAGDGPYWNLRANGGMLSTVDDLYRWERALAAGSVLPASALAKLREGHVPVADWYAERWGEDTRYGYGWVAAGTPAGPLMAHGGTAAAFCAGLRRYLDRDAVLIFGTNHCPNRAVEHALRDTLESVLATGTEKGRSATGPGEPDAIIVRGEIGRRADEYLQRVTRERGFAGVVLVAAGDEVVLRKGYGLAHREADVPFTPGTVYDIGSITKQFTAAAILALEAEGRLSVGDTLGGHFEDVPPDKAGITIHQLLTHSAGIPDGFGRDYEVMPRDSLVKLTFGAPLEYEPGTGYAYSNAGYSILGTIVEKVSGRGYERFLRERLFEPAGMYETGYVIPAWAGARLAHGYTEQGDPWGTSLDRVWAGEGPYWNLRANGGILSTVDDQHRWHRALSAPGVLPPEQLEKLHRGYVVEEPDDPESGEYGYGWTHFRLPGGGRLMGHNGSNGIFYAAFRRFLDDDLVFVYGTNEFRNLYVDRELAELLLETARDGGAR